MSKLKLALDALRVESFEVSPAIRVTGTVKARADDTSLENTICHTCGLTICHPSCFTECETDGISCQTNCPSHCETCHSHYSDCMSLCYPSCTDCPTMCDSGCPPDC